MKEKTQMIILAGGSGERFGGELPKQFVKIAGKTVIEHTLEQVERSKVIDSVIIVIGEKFYDYMNDLALKNNFSKLKKIIIGGVSRQESSFAGLCACDEDTDNVLFHDAIRPFVSERILRDVVVALETHEAVDVAIPCADTIIKIDEEGYIQKIPKRKKLMRGQTPQGFKKMVIEEAYRRFWLDEDLEVTDDCGIVEYYELAKIYVVQGDEKNIKITYKEDAYLADKLFQVNSIDSSIQEFDEAEVTAKLTNRVGVIFGSSEGIGNEIYNILKQSNCKIYGFSRKNGCDISNIQAVNDALAKVQESEGQIDFIINTAGILKIGKLEHMEISDLQELINVDYLGAVNVTKAAIPYLRETKGSLILFTSSSYTRGRAMYSIYSSSKAAVVNFAQAVAEEVYEDGIRINVISPERTDTPMRRKNFGLEPKESLLDSKRVAQVTINTLLEEYTGQIIDVTRG